MSETGIKIYGFLPPILDFESMVGKNYAIREKYFYVLLCSVCEGREWTMFNDAPSERSPRGFSDYGLTAQVCKSARKKLKDDGFIECRYVHDAKGHRIGTEYRLVDARFARNPKAVHAAIFAGLGKGLIHSAGEADQIRAFRAS